MSHPTKNSLQDFIRDRAQIRSAFGHIAQTADMIKQMILLKNPRAFDHIQGKLDENRRDK